MRVLQLIHGLNAWLTVVVGCVVVAALLVEMRRDRTNWGETSRVAFVAVVHLQVVLGAATWIAHLGANDPVFSGNSEKGLWHAVLGCAAAVLVVLTLLAARRGHLVVALTAATIALFGANLSRVLFVLLGLVVAYGLAYLFAKPVSTNEDAVGAQPINEQSR